MVDDELPVTVMLGVTNTLLPPVAVPVIVKTASTGCTDAVLEGTPSPTAVIAETL